MAGPAAERMDERVVAQAKEQIARLRAELAGWESFVEAATQSPAFLPKLASMLLDPQSNGIPHPDHTAPQRQPARQNWQRVWTYLMATGNNWASIRQIMEGTGLKRDSVGGVLYTGGHRHIFETVKKPTGRTYWRIREQFTDENSVPLIREEPQDAQPQEQPAAVEDEAVEQAPKPQRTGPRPKHAPANWGSY